MSSFKETFSEPMHFRFDSEWGVYHISREEYSRNVVVGILANQLGEKVDPDDLEESLVRYCIRYSYDDSEGVSAWWESENDKKGTKKTWRYQQKRTKDHE